MKAVSTAVQKVKEKYAGNKSQIKRVTGIDDERLDLWEDGTARELSYLISFAKLMDEAEMPLTPFADARTAILEIFGPWMAKVEADLEELKGQRVQVIVKDTDKIAAGTPRELQKGVGTPARRGLGKAMADEGEKKGRTKKKAG